jgi:hypothetical protein
MMPKSFWIKERYNPQLGTYFVACGQLSKTAARKMEKSTYGDNTMHEYKTEQEYKKALDDLRASGASVH